MSRTVLDELPELPKAVAWRSDAQFWQDVDHALLPCIGPVQHAYTADQMREYARAALASPREPAGVEERALVWVKHAAIGVQRETDEYVAIIAAALRQQPVQGDSGRVVEVLEHWEARAKSCDDESIGPFAGGCGGKTAGYVSPMAMTELRALIDREYMDRRARTRLGEWADKVETTQEWRAEHEAIPEPRVSISAAAREYLEAREAYDAAKRPDSQWAVVRELPHGSPIAARLREARSALRMLTKAAP